MKKHIILTGTALAAVALCWALWGGTPEVVTVPTPAVESAVSAPCAPQTQQSELSSNIIITEPVTQPETVEVTGSAASPEQDCPQETPQTIPEPQPTEEPAAELPATISKPTEETPPAQDGARKRYLCHAQGDGRACLCGCKGETRDALYTS